MKMSEIDSDCVEWNVDDTNYVCEAEQTVYNYSEISIENALVLNKQMRVYLTDLKDALEQMLRTCQEKYKQNEIHMVEMNKAKHEPKLYATYYFCGYPFFKDRKGGAPPLSAEYLRRSEKGDELFPLDLEKRGLWLPRDKVELVQGVKKQTIEYLQSQNRTKIRKTVGKRCASELLARIQHESTEFESMHLKELLRKTEGTDFRINWLNISMDELQDRHLPNECMAIWYGYLMPTLNRKNWTSDEEDKLLNAANEFDNQDWTEIAHAVNNRSAYQCFVHYHTIFNKDLVAKNVRWTPSEDKQLIECVDKYRTGNVIPWSKIMEHFPGRIKPQLYNRYMFSLNPEINRMPFTIEEDCILMAAIKEYGLNWREFPSNLLPGRTRKQIRSRYNNVLKFVNVREHWTEQHDILLMELVEKYGPTEWSRISDEMVSHTRTSCRQRYTTIKKFLDKHPNKSVTDVPRRRRAFSTNVTTDNWMEAIIDAKNFDSIHVASEIECRNVRPVNVKKIVAKVPLYNTPYYEFLKLSFNFKYAETIPGSDALFENIQIACQLLQAPHLPQKIDLYNPSFSGYVTMWGNCKKVQLEAELLKSLIQLGKNDFQFPVNFNTILGLRGLSAMFDMKSNEETKVKKGKKVKNEKNVKQETTSVTESNSFDGFEALDLFKSRFKSIFKHTATLAKARRTITSVSLRLRNKQWRRKAPEAIVSTTTDFHNNETLVCMKNDATRQNEHSECAATSENEENPSKRSRITVLESVTVGLDAPEDVDPLRLLQASTSKQSNKCYKYHVEMSDSVQKISIGPYVSESENEGMMSDDPGTFSNTEFVIWTPTITDEATGSASTNRTE